MISPSFLVRPWAWWFNKVPLSVTVMLLLMDGGSLDMRAAVALALVVLTVCAVGNYGYAVNDLYDMVEDARIGRANAGITMGRRRIGLLIAASGLLAELLAAGAVAWRGAVLTIGELALPLGYSVPPLRIKERGWLGIVADAVAAHVYPVVLALMTVTYFGIWQPAWPVIGCALGWSFAAGVRGILSHLLHSAERDRAAALTTIVHQSGRATIERCTIATLPIEIGCFIGLLVLCRSGPVLWGLGVLYLACEAFRSVDHRSTVTIFRPEGQRYIPFVEERFYKAWGPIAIGLDAARIDLMFLVLIPLYALLFRPHLRKEFSRLCDL